MSNALELWATAELRDGRIERAGHLYALADSSWPVGYRVWPTDAEEHRKLDTELRAALSLATGTSRCSPRRVPPAWTAPLTSSSSPIRRRGDQR